jgi:hypothetical protein
LERDEKDRYDGIVSYGIGKALQVSSSMIGYGMIDVSAHTEASRWRIRPHFGLRSDAGRLRTLIFAGVESEGYNEEFTEVWGGKAQYQLNDRQALHLEVSNERASRVMIGSIWFW